MNQIFVTFFLSSLFRRKVKLPPRSYEHKEILRAHANGLTGVFLGAKVFKSDSFSNLSVSVTK